MKIVYTIEDFSIKGGAEHIIAEKANYFATVLHHEVTIISIYHDERPNSYYLHPSVHFISLNIPFVGKKQNIIQKSISRVTTLLMIHRKIQNLISQLSPDVIFFTLSIGALLLPVIKTQAKKIYESHSARPFTPYHRFFKWMERKADLIICLTNDDAKEYTHAKRTYVIPNFISLPQHTVKNYCCKKAIAVGRLEYPKGFDRLINSWYKIAKLHPDWHLDIYGEGSLHTKLQEQITSLNLSKHVTLCGRKENMMEIYPNYSLHVMSSHYEGQPIALIEAQACGLPSVTFDFKFGANDIIRNGMNGILVEQGNEEAYTNAISKMLPDAKIREIYGKKALQIGKLYSQEIIFQKWINLLSTFEKTL